MSSRVEPIAPGASWSRLAVAVERIQAADSREAGLEVLAQAALELAVPEPASAPLEPGSVTCGAEPPLWALENAVLRQRLVEKEERLRLALDAASLGTWEHVPSTHASHWNVRSKAIFGLAPDEELDFDR
jgi:PAS domain-containing protein